ncbi:MAG: Crp/Fnr family transcriptional regulator [Fastidiosipilaceae bacterium]|jgi:CRP-like cAMP-binding protein|nr:Crp/Fnr family transcriptional regulator [Clostridiaceae bacterium]
MKQASSIDHNNSALTEEILRELTKTELFNGLDTYAVEDMLVSMPLPMISYTKNEIILHQGDYSDSIGLILDGSCIIERTDVWGNRQLINVFNKGEMFSEVFAIVGDQPLKVSVVAGPRGCRCIFVSVDELIQHSDLPSRAVVLSNLMRLLSRRNLFLTQKIELLSERTTKRKLLRFFSMLAESNSSTEFKLPFSRQELADYLCVDRSAMTKELFSLHNEGQITIEGRNITLHV